MSQNKVFTAIIRLKCQNTVKEMHLISKKRAYTLV